MTVAARTFTLSDTITDEQKRQLDEQGYLVFRGVLSPEEVATVRAEIDELAERWTAEKRRWVRGIPLFYGRDQEERPFLQRMAFTSCYAPSIHAIVNDSRFEPVRTLIGNGARVGEYEKDGVVFNRYLNVPGSSYRDLGWHTDALRDIFYLRRPRRQLNVGLHFDRVTRADGGLRLIPGSHRQSVAQMILGKAQFLDHREDPGEIVVETEPGDLTIHDGRLWHRVARSTKSGPASLRRTMYVPYLTDAPQPKGEDAKTPVYHYGTAAAKRARLALYDARRRFLS
jgi:hypothetical protein